MPLRGWGRHVKHNKWCLPSTEQDMQEDSGQSPWAVDCKLRASTHCAQLCAQSRWSKGTGGTGNQEWHQGQAGPWSGL